MSSGCFVEEILVCGRKCNYVFVYLIQWENFELLWVSLGGPYEHA